MRSSLPPLGLVISSIAASLASPAVVTARAIASLPAQRPKTSSQLLEEGEAHQQKNEHAKAGQLYRNALEALAKKQQRGNEGARAARLSADAYWLAFAQDLDVNHLQAALDVLSLWLTFTGPDSRATMVTDVQRLYARIRAIREPLGHAEAALIGGDARAAKAHYDDVLDAMANQGREWTVGARIVVRAAEGCMAIHAANVPAPHERAPRLHDLEAARALLVSWKREQPADDASGEGSALDDALARVDASIRGEKARANQAAQDHAKATEEWLAAVAAAEASRASLGQWVMERLEHDDGTEQRTLGIALLIGGAVASSGAADAFGAGLEARRASNERASVGAFVGGSVLATGALAAGVIGIIKLARARRSRVGMPRSHSNGG